MADGTSEINTDSIAEQPLPTPRRHRFLFLAFSPSYLGTGELLASHLEILQMTLVSPTAATDQKTWRLDMCWDKIIFLPKGQHT